VGFANMEVTYFLTESPGSHKVHWPSLPSDQATLAARVATIAAGLRVPVRVIDLGRPGAWWAKLTAWRNRWSTWPVLVGRAGVRLVGPLAFSDAAVRDLLLRARGQGSRERANRE